MSNYISIGEVIGGIAEVGETVRYTGEIDKFTGSMMKTYLTIGDVYKVSEVTLNYENHLNHNYYRFSNIKPNYWYACQCFRLINPRNYMARKFDLR